MCVLKALCCSVQLHMTSVLTKKHVLCKAIHVHAGGALGGDVLHAAEPWGLGLPWGDANVTGALT
jgi:hypothetical protein